jgi:hypothetical protein
MIKKLQEEVQNLREQLLRGGTGDAGVNAPEPSPKGSQK